MSSAVFTFDTLKYANTLKSSGCPPQQAEAQAQALAEIFETNSQDLATKADILAVKNDLKQLEQRIDARFAQVDARFIQLEQRMTIKLGSLMVLAIGAVAAIARFMPGPLGG
jgi:hypothetical protein